MRHTHDSRARYDRKNPRHVVRTFVPDIRVVRRVEIGIERQPRAHCRPLDFRRENTPGLVHLHASHRTTIRQPPHRHRDVFIHRFARFADGRRSAHPQNIPQNARSFSQAHSMKSFIPQFRQVAHLPASKSAPRNPMVVPAILLEDERQPCTLEMDRHRRDIQDTHMAYFEPAQFQSE